MNLGFNFFRSLFCSVPREKAGAEPPGPEGRAPNVGAEYPPLNPCAVDPNVVDELTEDCTEEVPPNGPIDGLAEPEFPKVGEEAPNDTEG